MRPSGNSPERWLAYREVNPGAKTRMFCFPYAGGGASIFRGWAASLPSGIEVCPVQLPGRESRLREPAFTDMKVIVPAVADALEPYLNLPCVFFGHSMGAGVAFDLARELRRRGRPEPLHLFVAGRRAPHLPARDEPIHGLPEPEFIAKLRELNGTPEEVLQHEELMKLLIPILRADFAVNENYEYVEGEPLAAGISAFGGLGDEDVTREDIEGWKEHTRGPFRARMMPGDHFFLHSGKELLLEAITRDLAELSAAPQRIG